MKLDIVKKIAKRVLWIGALIIILVLGSLIYRKYFFTYSDGSRSGLLQTFTHKGNLFKTYEGELILSPVSGPASVAMASERFLFSVTDDSLAKMLDTLQGQYIRVHYKQKKGTLPWKGDSPYFVDEAKVINKP
jgi:hypothetical protein